LQAVGRVIELGPQADKFPLGRKVVTMVERGAYAELLIASSSLCVAAPDDADDAVLAVLPMQGLTAYFMPPAAAWVRWCRALDCRGKSIGLDIGIAQIP
jgi:NADPH2:quinone reductase